ncbi:redoxin domain-containing protein [Psychrobacillus sp. FSL H8-0483]|uniref:peroxiredoxin family protein n=1 Tax=Psychrobacillus sp. FSL H8-0483 TaxID=2921389 RepID=UPI003159F5E8
MVAAEWYKIFSLTVPSTWIAFILAAVLTGFILYVKFGKETSSQFGDILFVFLFVWKFSVLFTDFSNVIKHPWMLLYFSGEQTGVYIGVVSVILYILYRQLRQKVLLNDSMHFAFMSFYSSYAVLVVFFNQSSLYKVLLTLGVAVFLGWLLMNYAASINWCLPFLFVFGALHLILQGTLLSTSMITASMLGLFLFLKASNEGVLINKKGISLSILALLFGAILWTIDEAVVKQEQINQEIEVVSSEGKEKAPNFTLTSLSGKELSLADYKGKRVILNFWATWCPPCKAEMPHMQTYFEEYAEEQNAIVLAVNLTSQDNGIKKIQQFNSEYNLTFPVLLDEKGDVASQYGIITIPTTFVLDEEGYIDKKISGPVSEHMLINLLEQLAK